MRPNLWNGCAISPPTADGRGTDVRTVGTDGRAGVARAVGTKRNKHGEKEVDTKRDRPEKVESKSVGGKEPSRLSALGWS